MSGDFSVGDLARRRAARKTSRCEKFSGDSTPAETSLRSQQYRWPLSLSHTHAHALVVDARSSRAIPRLRAHTRIHSLLQEGWEEQETRRRSLAIPPLLTHTHTHTSSRYCKKKKKTKTNEKEVLCRFHPCRHTHKSTRYICLFSARTNS